MNLPSLKEAKKRTNLKVEYIYNKEEESSRVLDGQKYFLRTYGCQMNVHDSEQIKCDIESLGAKEVESIEDADIIVLNTCAIRENAHDKVFGFLGRCKHLKKKKPHTTIVICGCMAQEESVVEELINKHSYIDIVIGTHNIHELKSKLINKLKIPDIDVYSIEGNVIEGASYARDSKISAWVNIMYGCDKFCTYCIVPYTRGKQRSRKPKDIIKEVKELIDKGYKEVTLLGQNVNAYGMDLTEKITFANLLRLVSDTGIERVRFMTSHPWDFTDELINIIKSKANIMPYIHLPIQSGSNKILSFMGRKYTKEEYVALFNKIKNTIPYVSVTTDIIVGFPGEAEEDFKETLNVVDMLKFDGAFTFVFSARVGTPAAKMKDDISLHIKEERLQRLNKKVNKYALLNNKEYLYKVVPVLIAGISEKDDTKLYGYTDTMKLVNIIGNKSFIGKIVPVKITKAKTFSLDGQIKKG